MLSVVIPVWSATPLLVKMHVDLCKSVIEDCDELIVCEDGPYSPDVARVCDRYLTHPTRLGHPQNLQFGIDRAIGDFIGVLDADIIIKKGTLRDLCVPGKFVQSKLLTTTNRTGFIIWCSVADKKLYDLYKMPTGDILDDWAANISYDLIYQSDKVEYIHNSGIVYSEWQKLHRQEIELGKPPTGFRR